MLRAILSSIVFVVTIVLSIWFYIIVVNNYGDGGWFVFVLLLCLVTFFLGMGIFISALIIEPLRRRV